MLGTETTTLQLQFLQTQTKWPAVYQPWLPWLVKSYSFYEYYIISQCILVMLKLSLSKIK